jgi:Gly-Xaa carboxypeptidase
MSNKEKLYLPVNVSDESRCQARSRWKIRLIVLVLAGCLLWNGFAVLEGLGIQKEDLCPQPDALYPVKNAKAWDVLGENVITEEFKFRAADLLGGAVRIP